jgi:hypothetical protein
MASFNEWFASLLGQSQHQVERLLHDRTATHFLIAWSLFESKCFGGYVQTSKFDSYVADTINSGFDVSTLSTNVEHFHARYQDKERFKHLMHTQSSSRLSQALSFPAEDLSAEECLHLLVFVAYRFRNNIFHGNKGVDTWLGYSEQIRRCTELLQACVSHAEARLISLRSEDAA